MCRPRTCQWCWSLALTLLGGFSLGPLQAQAQLYELRTYTTNEGKLDDLNARFRDHTIGLFEKHGMKSIAYWHPMDEPDSNDTLIYILRHDSREAATSSWRAFGSDPDWREAARQSGVGRLAKAPEVTYMKATDYSAMQ